MNYVLPALAIAGIGYLLLSKDKKEAPDTVDPKTKDFEAAVDAAVADPDIVARANAVNAKLKLPAVTPAQMKASQMRAWHSGPSQVWAGAFAGHYADSLNVDRNILPNLDVELTPTVYPPLTGSSVVREQQIANFFWDRVDEKETDVSTKAKLVAFMTDAKAKIEKVASGQSASETVSFPR